MHALGLALLAAVVAGLDSDPGSLGEPAPKLARLFTPLSVPPGTYRVFRSNRPAADLAATLKSADAEVYPGEWAEQRPEGMAAFEAGGTADRSRLARLFTGSRVTLYRGTIHTSTGFVSYTVISPFPDPSLSRLEPDTLVIRFEVPPPRLDP